LDTVELGTSAAISWALVFRNDGHLMITLNFTACRGAHREDDPVHRGHELSGIDLGRQVGVIDVHFVQKQVEPAGHHIS